MARFINSGSRGTDDPTIDTLPFMAAKTAKEQGTAWCSSFGTTTWWA